MDECLRTSSELLPALLTEAWTKSLFRLGLDRALDPFNNPRTGVGDSGPARHDVARPLLSSPGSKENGRGRVFSAPVVFFGVRNTPVGGVFSVPTIDCLFSRLPSASGNLLGPVGSCVLLVSRPGPPSESRSVSLDRTTSASIPRCRANLTARARSRMLSLAILSALLKGATMSSSSSESGSPSEENALSQYDIRRGCGGEGEEALASARGLLSSRGKLPNGSSSWTLVVANIFDKAVIFLEGEPLAGLSTTIWQVISNGFATIFCESGAPLGVSIF
jgi:hypothetical protein